MSAASYNRGSKLISDRLDREQPPAELRLLRDLSDYSAANNGTVIFDPTVVRFGPRAGEVSIMNRQRGGWASYCFTYTSLWQIARHWRLVFLELSADEHSKFIRVAPNPTRGES